MAQSEAVEVEGDAVRNRPGRPRDVDVDRRIILVARQLYGERGWSGFNFDVVAKTAKVSKDAIYRRYKSKVDLLAAAMTATDVYPNEQAVEPNETLRGYLLAVARDHFNMYAQEGGFDYLRIYIEAPRNPEMIAAYHDQSSMPNVIRIRHVVRNAMAAGILPELKSPTSLIDAIIGGVVMHVMATPPDLRDRMIAKADTYLEQLVDLALRGAGYDYETATTLGDLTGEI